MPRSPFESSKGSRPYEEGSRQNAPSTSHHGQSPCCKNDGPPSCCSKNDGIKCCESRNCLNNIRTRTNERYSVRSQSAPPTKFDYHIGVNTVIPRGKGNKGRNICESSLPPRIPCPLSVVRNATASQNWDESSAAASRIQMPQRQCCQQPSNQNWRSSNDAMKFEPDINSTMVGRNERCHREEEPQGMSNSYCMSQNTRSNSRQSRRQQCESPEMPRRCQYGSPEMVRKTGRKCDTINETSYMMPPEALRNPRSRRQPFSDQSYGQDNYYPEMSKPQAQSCCRSNKSSACGKVSPNNTSARSPNSSTRPHKTYMEMSQALSGRTCLSQTEIEKAIQTASHSTRFHGKSPEDRLAERTKTDFLQYLVKDSFCPGTIQESLNGQGNFNEHAFEISFAGSVPSKPYPVDPITMLEAIKMRIDIERDEVRKAKQKEWERQHGTREKTKDGKPKHAGPIQLDDIDAYFEAQNHSEVNDGVAAFLKAETEFHELNRVTDSGFQAEVNTLETNFFDDKIKVNLYNATTQPSYN
ncbi:uncharacterized protein Dana_GF10548 [Drosophila ananassae]|uniref:Uncharacterized protein n=1 Tax=Drosophila ananassae TaxID=7217 RepID=A0A0P8YI21_DROAN|nr:uncharacterized protein LOC6493417 [Drosophila ananassae]KPU78607.1 uncharacterized protein Dana_GF10548 [Drosophila ananassae]